MESVPVSVETISENQIQEIGLDGTEFYVQPLSMSENLTKLAHKIDFSKDESEEKGKPTSEGETEITEEEKALAKFQPSLWPWDSVRTKLKNSLTEMSVLLDVLNIAKERRYMVLDPVQQEPPEQRPAMLLMAKKKGLQEAASILLEGAERLRKSQQEKNQNRGQPDFHTELRKLRQHWRLKKVGNTILGDLSYKSAGSRFWQSGTFEVIKSDLDEDPPPAPPSKAQLPRSPLRVVVPSELDGVAYIQVALKRAADSADFMSANVTMPSSSAGIPEDAPWQRKLEAAQNVIFCKELFAQLAREAVQSQSKIPNIVVGNQIIVPLFPGIQLTVTLSHITGREKRTPGLHHKQVHNQVLEHSLHQLLREMHHKNIHHPMPHPVTASLGVSKRRRLAGPQAFSKQELSDMMESESLLDQIINQAKHMILRSKTMQLIDHLTRTLQDPQLMAHWNTTSTATQASCRVDITSLGYESIRTSFYLTVGMESIKAECRDGRIITLSYEQGELRDLVLSQMYQHQVTMAQHLCKLLGWQVLSSSLHLGLGNMEPLGSYSSIMMASPSGQRVLSIKTGPTTGSMVYVQHCPRKGEENNSKNIVTDPKWNCLGGEFQSINYQKVEGRNFVSKIETLMASLP